MDWRHADNPRPFTWSVLARDERPVSSAEQHELESVLEESRAECQRLAGYVSGDPAPRRGLVVGHVAEVQEKLNRMLRLMLGHAVAADSQEVELEDQQARRAAKGN